MMSRFSPLTALCSVVALLLFSCENQNKRILVIGPPGSGGVIVSHIIASSRQQGFRADTTSREGYLTEDSLQHYKTLVLVGISPETLSYRQQADLERYVQGGGGLMVINGFQDTVLNWPWYKTLTDARVSAGVLPFESRYDGGRIFFAKLPAGDDPLGATDVITQGLDFTMKGRLDPGKATTARVPEDNRFVFEVLDTYMYEPMEMVIFDDGRVLYIERRGDVKLYDPKAGKSRTIATFDVSITGNYEDGMLGVALDPDFEKNNWIYINYSPAGAVAKQNVSRFEMRGDSLIMASEKIVLEIPTQRETCCHSGGHLEFGPNGDLYISTGDNTSSKESDGFSPIDERPGRAPFDAQKSSGNTHDLRGKILRIHPEPDGSYSIPDGNLFPRDGSLGKPEIYVMGTRNAFRFTVDDHNGIVYWGDVGPDGGVSNERGPESYDEWNQARKPGNYGWPYFVADNKAYADFDFETNTIGPRFIPDEPVNNSPNNTGARVLPPAQKPMIWYPYGESKEFPILGKGSRSAMSGPVYYHDDFKHAPSRFPAYFDGKLFIYEWARSWVKVVSFDEDVNLVKIEPFLPEQEWYKPIDMKFGLDGSLYVLQYGANYFEHNPDSRLVKITYVEGNRAPRAVLRADRTVGAVPLTVELSAGESFDFDRNEKLTFSWSTGASAQDTLSTGKKLTVTYDTPGIYTPEVKVTDKEGRSSTAKLEIRAGNEPPRVTIDLGAANRSFYSDNARIGYSVTVADNEDGETGKGIDPSSVFVSFDYLREGKDLALLASNADMAGDITTVRGKLGIASSDCKTCHQVADKSIGPSYVEIARRYDGKRAEKMLVEKILKGGNGNWGKNMMAAHPQHTAAEAAAMVKYILSLSQPPEKMALSGTVVTRDHARDESAGYYVLRANYTDRGSPVTGNLTGSSLLALRHPRVEAEHADISMNTSVRHVDGSNMSFVGGVQHGGYLGFRNIDLRGIGRLHLKARARVAGSVVEVRAGSPQGALLGAVDVPPAGSVGDQMTVTSTPLPPGQPGPQDLYLVFRNKQGHRENIVALDWVFFDNGTTRSALK